MANPFLIVGAPRTGSTLLRKVLSGHPDLAIPPESGFLAEYLVADHVPLEKRKLLFCVEPEFDYWGIRPAIEDIDQCSTMMDCIRLVHEKYAQAEGKRYWGQKTPKLVRTGKLWLDRMPDCHIIHMVRDPRGVANSLRESKYHNLHLIHGSTRYQRDTRLGLELEEAYPDRVMRLSYEQLVTAPDEALQSVCQFIDLPWKEMELLNSSPSLTPNEMKFGHHQNLQGGIAMNFVDQWKVKLSREEVAIVEHLAGDLMNRLGYPSFEIPAAPTSQMRSQAQRHHLKHNLAHGLKELTQRPDFWRIAHRRWKLGNIGRMFRDQSKGM